MHDEKTKIWLEKLGQGDVDATEKLWHDYFEKMVRLAVRKMQGLRLRAVDGEDIALSAMNSFYRMVQKRDEPIEDSVELWKLLATITRRKANKERQRQMAGKRSEFYSCIFGGKLPIDSAGMSVTMICPRGDLSLDCLNRSDANA